MKKLLYFLFLLPLGLLCSCGNDDLAPFDMTLTLSGVTQVDGTFYAVSGDNVSIQNLTVNPVGGKATTMSNVLFYIDGYLLFPNPWSIDGVFSFSTTNLSPGAHTIGVSGNILQEDKSVQTFAANYTLVIAKDMESLPEGAPELGSYSETVSFSK